MLRVRPLLLLLVLLPQLLVLGLGRDLVVCLAPDGHVELELASSSCCEALTSHEAGEDAGASDEGRYDAQEPEDCGPCRDLPLLVDGGVAPMTSPTLALDLVAPPACFGPRRALTVTAHGARAPRPRPPLRALTWPDLLRSVVLRT